MKNPFSLSFGREPISFIDRSIESNEIIESFSDDNPSYQVCMIIGVRGSGKTVMLTDIAKHFRKDKEWIVIDLSSEMDLLHSFAAALSNHNQIASILHNAKINLSVLGLGVEIDGTQPITDINAALERILEAISRHGRKILITIDEAVCNQSMREFASMFQIFMRRDFPVYLIMTGLYENIYELQNEKTLTFLYRAPKIELKPLNIRMTADKYREIFSITEDEALAMAKETCGYPFAFQVLGYLCWKNNAKWSDVLNEYSRYLDEYVYEKMWSELSAKDKDVLKAIAQSDSDKVEHIRSCIDINSGTFNIYRSRLLRKGLVKSTEYGHLTFTLPRFKEFVQTMEFLEQ